jgi:2-polyprenyl-3-methyl-5-hydroxy-6-metoxy-1,4-benzoquinol methylase
LHELVERFIRREARKKAAPLVILDAGCGTGRMLERAARYGAADGFDFSEEALRFCATRGLKNITRQDLNSWQPPMDAYDVIITMDVLCHSTIVSEEDVYKKFHTALKPGGLLIVNLPAFEMLKRQHDRAVHTKKRYTKSPTVKEIKKIGFAIERGSYRVAFLFGIMLVKKTIERITHDASMHSDLTPLPRWLNAVLLFVNRLENVIVGSGIPLPVGGSLFIVCRK